MMITKNIIKAAVTAVLTKRFWRGQNLAPRTATSDEGRMSCFELMIATVSDAVADIIIECREVGTNHKRLILDTVNLWTDPGHAEEAMFSIVDTLHNKFDYDV